MGEKFNSGYGGYICDGCRVLLWAGVKAKDDQSKRKFIYYVQAEDIVETDTEAFCSRACYETTQLFPSTVPVEENN